MDSKEQLDQSIAQEEIPIPPNRWLGMFTKPLAILEYIFRYQPDFGVHRNFIFTGTMFAMATRLPDWLAKGSHPIEVMVILLAAGPFTGLLMGYIFAAISTWFGKMLSPVSDKKQMRTSMAWSGFVFGMVYTIFWITYLICFYLRPDPVEKYILGNAAIGWVPVIIAGAMFLYALWVRWKSMAYTLQAPLSKAIACWLAAFILTYVPIGIMAYGYFGLYTRSLNWIMSAG